jgi:hypothetical protein
MTTVEHLPLLEDRQDLVNLERERLRTCVAQNLALGAQLARGLVPARVEFLALPALPMGRRWGAAGAN